MMAEITHNEFPKKVWRKHDTEKDQYEENNSSIEATF
jgi:hypothetical protein